MWAWPSFPSLGPLCLIPTCVPFLWALSSRAIQRHLGPLSAIFSPVTLPTPEHQQALSDIFFQQGVLFCSAEGGAHCHMQPPDGAQVSPLPTRLCPSHNHIPARNSFEFRFWRQHLPKECLWSVDLNLIISCINVRALEYWSTWHS